MNNKINIELAFLDKFTRNILTYFFQSNLCKSAKLVKPTEETDLYIVDQSKLEEDFLNEKIKKENKFFIVLYKNDRHKIPLGNVLWLEKPIDTFKLVKLTSEVQKKVYRNSQIVPSSNKQKKIGSSIRIEKEKIIAAHHNQLYNAVHEENEFDIHQRFKSQKFVGSNKDISNTTPIPDNVFLNPNKHLYHYLIEAKKRAKTNKSSIVLKNFIGNIIYNPKEKIFIHNLQPNQLKYLQTSTLFQNVKMEFINEKMVNGFAGNHKINEVNFIWETAIQASKGRVPKNTSLNQPVNLIAWPNFSKLQIFRYAIQISAVWAKYNLSLIETAKQLQIPQRYVFTLYCAMHAMGYANINKNRETDSAITNKSNNSSLFSRIIGHIFG